MAYLIINNSDRAKYGSLITKLSSQFSMKVNQYPETVNDAVDILNQHKFDEGWKKKKKKSNTNHNNDSNKNQNKTNENS